MRPDEFSRFCKEGIAAGQRRFADAARALLARADADIFEALADAPDDALLEPCLFAYFATPAPSVPLGQVVFGLLPRELRPEAIEVRSDARGRVHLPRVGWLVTERPDRSLVLEWDEGRGELALVDGDAPVPHRFVPRLVVPGTDIEVCRYHSPLLAPVLCLPSGERASDVAIDGLGEAHLPAIARALSLIQKHAPDYYDDIARVTRLIVPFDHPDMNSFAGVSAHGAAFVNLRLGQSPVFFVDDLVHQCGHVIWSAVTVDRAAYFTVPPDSPVGGLSGDPNDTRTLYAAFHGVFTEWVMCRCLRALDEREALTAAEAHEVIGRLAFIAGKYAADLRRCSHDAAMSALGRRVYAALRDGFESLWRERRDVFGYDLAGHAYNYDHATFVRRNPGLRAAASAGAAP